MPKRSPGAALRALASVDLIASKGVKVEDRVERHFIQGHSAKQAAIRMGRNADDVAELYAEFEAKYKQLDNDALRLRLLKVLARSEFRSAKFRRAVRFLEKQRQFSALSAALKDERDEDMFQVALLTKHLIKQSLGDEAGKAVGEAITNAMFNALNSGDEGELTEKELSISASIRKSIRHDAEGDDEDELDPDDEVEQDDD